MFKVLKLMLRVHKLYKMLILCLRYIFTKWIMCVVMFCWIIWR